jgi:ParB-like chromosome segregation protein Spo0J
MRMNRSLFRLSLVVQRRLKLANVSPRLLADYRGDAVTLEQLMALAITDDHAAQEAAFYESPQWQRSPEALRDHLTHEEIDAGRDALAKFVGVQPYEQAGGAVRRDLFADEQNELKFSPYITDAVVIGDKKAYLTVIIMIDQENVEKYAQDNDVPFSNYASLTKSPEVQALIQAELDRVNAKFARVEQIKKFFLLDTQLSAEDEELTPTMKLKRKLVQQKYSPQIEAMYR